MKEAESKPESPVISLLVNIVIPVCILTFMSKPDGMLGLGPVWALIIAVAFPVTHGIKTVITKKKADVLAIIGLVSVLLTGVFGLKQLPKEWMIVKEAAIPLVIGLVIVISLKTPFPLIKKLMLTDAIFDLERLHQGLKDQNNEERFEKRLVGLSWGFAGVMLLSSVLSGTLAALVLKSPPGSPEYAAELGKMTGLSNTVVLIPVMIAMLFVFNALFNTLTKLTGLELDDVLAAQHRKPKKECIEEPTAE
ncbi:MAG: hypothetical protein JXR25_17395 [Pontiellaceae bacterium]|nr:hypothetical protein [Pontiellaceae bacterium]MBN2786596.1 hypothetical protein [Pontiellaceae bacterium]